MRGKRLTTDRPAHAGTHPGVAIDVGTDLEHRLKIQGREHMEERDELGAGVCVIPTVGYR
ncbi:MAG: hypothetical protein ACYDHH_27440 [Solirubrobacteraceae bacterium]